MANAAAPIMGHAAWRRLAGAAWLLLMAGPLTLGAQERTSPHAIARAHAIAGRTDRAIALFDSLRAIVPMDRDATLGAATALAWGKRYAEAELRYRDMLVRWPADLEAAQGLARVTAWRGDWEASERQWRALLDRDPQHPEHWLGLAQVLRWQNRRGEALGVLERGLSIAPSHPELRAERRRAYAAYANAIEPIVRQSNDSEGNSFWSVALTASIPLSHGHQARLTAVERSAGLGARAGRSRGVEGSAELAFGELGALLIEAGAQQLADAEQPSRLQASGRLRGRWLPRTGLRFDGSVGRTVLDETAPLIANAIVVDGGALATQLQLRDRWRLAVGGGVSTLRGGTEPNRRQEWDVALVAAPSDHVELGARVRQVQHARLATDGYFSPRRHDIAEATVRWEPGQTVGWGARFEGALGTQQVTLAGPAQRGPAQRAYVGLARRWELGGQLQLGYEYTSVAGIVPLGVSTPAEYRRHGVVIGARLPLLR